jgi:hypothetical protein
MGPLSGAEIRAGEARSDCADSWDTMLMNITTAVTTPMRNTQ